MGGGPDAPQALGRARRAILRVARLLPHVVLFALLFATVLISLTVAGNSIPAT